VNLGKLHGSFKNLHIFDPLSLLHKAWKWLCICENEATIDYHHGSAPKFRISCRRSL